MMDLKRKLISTGTKIAYRQLEMFPISFFKPRSNDVTNSFMFFVKINTTLINFTTKISSINFKTLF